MLVLSRKDGERIVIGEHISIKVLSIKGNTVRLGIEAPDSVSIVRGEIVEKTPDRSEQPRLDASPELTTSAMATVSSPLWQMGEPVVGD